MLLIKKKFKIVRITHSLQFLLKNKDWNLNYRLKKSQSTSVILRSPKHFNIGKQKIVNLSYKLSSLEILLPTYLYFSNFLINTKALYSLLQKTTNKSLGFSNKSVKLIVETKFKLMWLEF